MSLPPPQPTLPQLAQTGQFIASLQQPDGALPWFPGGQWDAWNHTEAVLGLTVAGVATGQDDVLARARQGLQHLADTQRPDGTWPMEKRDGVVTLTEADTNQCAYPAVGVWHYVVATGDVSAYRTWWPMVEAALRFVVAHQRPDGTIPWAVNERGNPGDHALLTGCSSILQALWAGREIARTLTLPDDWLTTAGVRLSQGLAGGAGFISPRSRHAMDWFYPVLGGALSDADARARLQARADEFVWPGWGVRCVHDHPWVTGGESAEYVMALMRLGQTETARRVLDDLAHLRAADGGYWTGYVVPDAAVWPVEKTGWTSGAIALATDAVAQLTPAANLFARIRWFAETPTASPSCADSRADSCADSPADSHPESSTPYPTGEETS